MLEYWTVSVNGGEIPLHLHPRFTSLVYRHPAPRVAYVADATPSIRRSVNYNDITDTRVLSRPFVWNYITYIDTDEYNIFEVQAEESIWNKYVIHGSMVAMGTVLYLAPSTPRVFNGARQNGNL